ncbi:MAG: hypothetical protein A3K19_01135 [Lentisphaerae bacterium RIFOXYB12_FULL_65_16]|nr:MAG: hypothetical protein A3K18_21830 [Lentisphaerae bacterium RIFOXYA12_64_32]OGV93727.1 MAG: hypothetical protein A3K19_01135 [Lentisphaerae bacterium RIFOXYB12_FULL_65_16]
MLKLWDNPIFLREFRTNARCRKTLVMTLVLIVSLALLILVLWPRTGIFSQFNTDEIFSVFLNLNLALIILLVPAFVSTTITIERENQSFDLLSTSLLTPSEIMFGKLFSSLAITFLVVIVSTPVTSVCALSGGISIPRLARAYSVILLATLTYGLLGLAISSLCYRSFTALVITYLGLMVLAGATWLPSVLLPHLVGLRPVWQALRSLSPFEALFALNHPERYEQAVQGFSAETVFTFYVVGMVVLSLVFFGVFCKHVLLPPPSKPPKLQHMYTDTRTMVRRKLMFPFYLIDPLRRKRPIPRWRNPVFVAEIRSRIFGKPKFILRSLATCMVISLVLLTLVAMQFATQLSPDMVRLVAIIFQVGVVAFFAPAVCSGSITDERTSGTLILLRMTRVSALKVVIGKIKAGLLYVLMFLASSLPVLWALTYLEAQASYWRIGAWMGILVLTTMVFVVAGLCASTITESTAAATAVSYVFSGIVCLGTLGVLLLGSRIGPELQTFVLTFNPLVAALQITSDTWFGDLPKLFGNRLWQNSLMALGGITLVLTMITALRVRYIFNHRV